MTADDLEGVHGILRKALREARAEDRPGPPYHAGGPALVCPALDQIRISLWCAKLLDHRAERGERAKMAKIDEAVAQFLANPREAGKKAPWRQTLVELGEGTGKASSALICMRRAASGAATYARGKPDLVHTSAQVSVVRVVKELAAEPRPMTVRAFLEELDFAMMRYEMAAAVRERCDATPTLDRVLFRGGNEKGKTVCWLATQKSGAFALLTQLGEGPRPKWSFIEGTREHVLASVPDQLFAAATARVGAEG